MIKYTMHKPGRSAINSFDLPTPWAIRTPAPSRDRRIVLSEPLPVYEVFGVALYEGGQPDGCCKRCGLHKCACVLATRNGYTEHGPDCPGGCPETTCREFVKREYAGTVQEADALPEGWTAPSDPNGNYVHVSGALAWTNPAPHTIPSQPWRWSPGFPTMGKPAATRSEAMAASLGFAIKQISVGGHAWHEWTRGADRDMRDTAEAAALSALAFDADQRRASKVETQAASDARWIPVAGYTVAYLCERTDKRAGVWSNDSSTWKVGPRNGETLGSYSAMSSWGRDGFASCEAAQAYADEQLAKEDAAAHG